VSISTSLPVRCPHCAAQVTAGSDWCSLCYADLRPAPEPEPEPEQEQEQEPVAAAEPAAEARVADGADAPAVAAPKPGRGKHSRVAPSPEPEAAAPLDRTEAEILADQLIAELAITEGGNRLGTLANSLDSTGKRLAVILGGAAAGIVVLILLMWGIGALV
jgi:hypothetical protein